MYTQGLNATDPLTQLAVSYGIASWSELVAHVCTLPYGRNKNRHNLALVIQEGKGTCSSKHALLKQLAVNNGFDQVRLFMGIYKMTETNTPGIGTALTDNNLDYIPEAHCYLKIEGKRYDYTSPTADLSKVIPDLLEEQEIQAEQVNTYKVQYHKDFLKAHMVLTNMRYSFDELWAIREACIRQLEKSRP